MLIIENEWEPYTTILIGNPNCKPRGCVEISVYGNDTTARLQNVKYYATCSTARQFQKNEGAMQVLLKIALKWLIRNYPHINKVTFTDESYYNLDNGQVLMLPEKLYLTEGHTWYSKHFGAKPSTRTRLVLKLFARAYKDGKQHFNTLPLDSWTEENAAKTLSVYPALYGKQISGTEWYITRETIASYDVGDPVWNQQGGGVSANVKRSFDIRRRPHIWK